MDFFEEYKTIAKNNNFEFGSAENNRMLIFPNDRVLNTKSCMLRKGSIVYYASDSYAAKAGMTSTYSGVYITLGENAMKFQAEITKRFWFDFMAVKKRVKTRNSYIDKHLAISTNNIEQLLNYIDTRFVNAYLELWTKYSPLKVVFGVDYIPLLPFKDKMIVGIELDRWVLPQDFNSTFNDLTNVVEKLNH